MYISILLCAFVAVALSDSLPPGTSRYEVENPIIEVKQGKSVDEGDTAEEKLINPLGEGGSDSGIRHKKSAATTTICVEIRPSDPYERPYNLCETGNHIYTVPTLEGQHSSLAIQGAGNSFAKPGFAAPKPSAPYPAAATSSAAFGSSTKTEGSYPKGGGYNSYRLAGDSFDEESGEEFEHAMGNEIEEEDGGGVHPLVRSAMYGYGDGYGSGYGSGGGGYGEMGHGAALIKFKGAGKKKKKGHDDDTHHHGLVITCHPNLAGYTSGVGGGYGHGGGGGYGPGHFEGGYGGYGGGGHGGFGGGHGGFGGGHGGFGGGHGGYGGGHGGFGGGHGGFGGGHGGYGGGHEGFGGGHGDYSGGHGGYRTSARKPSQKSRSKYYQPSIPGDHSGIYPSSPDHSYIGGNDGASSQHGGSAFISTNDVPLNNGAFIFPSTQVTPYALGGGGGGGYHIQNFPLSNPYQQPFSFVPASPIFNGLPSGYQQPAGGLPVSFQGHGSAAASSASSSSAYTPPATYRSNEGNEEHHFGNVQHRETPEKEMMDRPLDARKEENAHISQIANKQHPIENNKMAHSRNQKLWSDNMRGSKQIEDKEMTQEHQKHIVGNSQWNEHDKSSNGLSENKS